MLKTLYNLIGEYKRAALIAPFFTALEVVMGVLIPYVTASIIDKGIMTGDIQKIYYYGAIMVGLALISLYAGITSGKYSAYASTGFAYNLRDAMYKHVQTFSFSNIDKFSTPGLITRMTTDVSNLQNAFQQIIRVTVRAPLMLISCFSMSVFINAKLSLIFISAMLILGVLLFLIVSRTMKLFSQVFQRYDDLNSSVQENIAGIRVVKSFVREDYEKKKFSKAATNLYNLFVKAESLLAFNNPVMNLVVYGCIILLSWFGAKLIVADELTTGELTSLLAYVMNISMSLMMLSMIFVMLTTSSASAKRIFEVLTEKPSIKNPKEPLMDVADGSIDFEHVCFAYENGTGENALNDINLHIQSGETIGIIGGTGSGKSSLVNLISRLYDVKSGVLRVGGRDVREYDLETLRNSVSVVLQKNILFSGTILDNLRWGKEDATEEECREACRIACADEFIEQFPQGYHTHIEQGGTNVSGGQKQRLCLARALLKNPKILILDDSTSAVDTATDAKIRTAFASAIPDTTKLIISQRILSMQNANRILVLDHGQVSGFDTHDNLLRTNQIYQDIYRMQMENDGDFDESKEGGAEA